MNITQVFVYGSLRRGFGNHHIVESSKGGFLCRTTEHFTLYDLGAFPAVTLKKSVPIVGEVYTVSVPTMKRLDELEGFPEFYKRRMVQTPYGEAWMYYMEDCTRFGGLEIVDGDWLKHTERKYGR